MGIRIKTTTLFMSDHNFMNKIKDWVYRVVEIIEPK